MLNNTIVFSAALALSTYTKVGDAISFRTALHSQAAKPEESSAEASAFLQYQMHPAKAKALEEVQENPEVVLIAQQADGYPDVYMKQKGTAKTLCKIPNQQVLVKIADEGVDYLVRWNGQVGLVKRSNTLPAPFSGLADVVMNKEVQKNPEDVLIAQQADGYPDVYMKQKGTAKTLCKIPNQQVLVKIADEGVDYLVSWNGQVGLVKKTNTQTQSEVIKKLIDRLRQQAEAQRRRELSDYEKQQKTYIPVTEMGGVTMYGSGHWPPGPHSAVCWIPGGETVKQINFPDDVEIPYGFHRNDGHGNDFYHVQWSQENEEGKKAYNGYVCIKSIRELLIAKQYEKRGESVVIDNDTPNRRVELCKIPDGEILIKIDKKNQDFLVRWRCSKDGSVKTGLVNNLNTLPLKEGLDSLKEKKSNLQYT